MKLEVASGLGALMPHSFVVAWRAPAQRNSAPPCTFKKFPRPRPVLFYSSSLTESHSKHTHRKLTLSFSQRFGKSPRTASRQHASTRRHRSTYCGPYHSLPTTVPTFHWYSPRAVGSSPPRLQHSGRRFFLSPLLFGEVCWTDWSVGRRRNFGHAMI